MTSVTTQPIPDSAHVAYLALENSSLTDSWANAYSSSGFRMGVDSSGAVGKAASFYTDTSVTTSNSTIPYFRLGTDSKQPAAPTTSYTVAVWVKPLKLNAKQALIGYDGNTDDQSGSGFRLMLNTSGEACMDTNSSTCSVVASVGSTGQWSLIVATISGNTWTLYTYAAGSCASPIDTGVNTSVSVTYGTGGAWHVGAGFSNSNSNKYWGFFGSLDELRIWSRTLSQVEAGCLCSSNNVDACRYVGNSSETVWSTGTVTGTSSLWSTQTKTVTGTSSLWSTQTKTVTGTSSLWSTQTVTGTSSLWSTKTVTGTSSLWSTGTVTGSQSQWGTTTVTGSQSLWSTGTVTGSQSQWGTATVTGSQSVNSTATVTGSQSVNSTATVTGSQSVNSTATVTGSQSVNSTATVTGSQSVNSTATVTGSQSVNSTATVTGSQSVNSTATVTGSQSVNSTATVTGSQSGFSTATVSGSQTSYSTGPVSEVMTATGTASQSATVPSIVSYSALTTETESLSGTQTLTATATTTSALKLVPDLDDCTSGSCAGSSSYCYLNSSVACTSDSTCASLTKGDFCRLLNTGDGTGRGKNDFCVLPNPNPSAKSTCRYQQATTCSNDSNCNGGVGDYCVLGTPARMCEKTGLWCADDGSGCGSSDGTCVPATSRLVMVKNAVRRVMLEHAYDDKAVVKMGQMHSFQGDRSGNSDNLFPYVKLQTAAARSEVKFLPRSELLKGLHDGAACFSETDGPSGTCTVDYSGGGAVATPAVTYTLRSGSSNNSRYAVPTGDGRTYSRVDADWSSSCGMLCSFDDGKGLYEGSYYTFEYKAGAPVASGVGSLSQPQYYTTYQGKSFGSPGNYWTLMDAERSEFVNENKYGAREFAGSTWSTGAEYPLPLVGASGDPTSTAAICSISNGAQWDHNVVPMVNDTSFGGKSVKPVQKALLNAARLEKASYGGFYATGNIEPVACALKNDAADDEHHSVAGYMSVVKGRDGSACWENHVLLVVDGLPRGPGDVAVGGVDCSAAACEYSGSNQTLDNCHCPAVTKARALASVGVNVHVIAASTDVTSRNSYAAATLNNIARAGSTSTSFINIPRYAASEDELYYWLNYEMKEALRVTVATTPASAASGVQSYEGLTAGNMLFQTTVELPEWRGNLVGFNIGTATATSSTTATASTYTTTVAWRAATVNKFTVRPGSPPSTAEQKLWTQRKVFFSDATGHVRRIVVGDDAVAATNDGTIDSASKEALLALKLGANQTETERIVQWMLGKIDPKDTIDHKPLNPAVMGSVLNSMPIDVGPPGANSMPGGNHFWQAHMNRAEMVYLGADDGMLHAFYAADGQEAFAFIPADMVPIIAKLYAQGGQRYSPNEHVYGLSGSPKVKNLCVERCNVTGASCSDDLTPYDDATCPKWKTILVMGEGPGGNHPFALDITDPVPSGTPTLTDASLLWHVDHKNAAGISVSSLGETTSVPAFAYHQTADKSDYRVLMASGYPYPSGSSSTTQLIEAKAWDGAAPGGSGPGATISGSDGCDATTGQEFAMLADVAVARDYSATGDQNLLAAYVADTWGMVHQYAPGYSPVLRDAIHLGCGHPLHFSPAVVQLNRNNPNNESGNSVFLAQVTNSVLDPTTVAYSADKFPASKLVVAKLTTIGNNPPALDQTFGSSGLIQLSADASSAGNRLCGIATTMKTSAAADCGTDGSWLPTSARPTGTPVAVLRSDGSGFQLYTTWYTPPAANWDNCPGSSTNGNSYITLHEFLSDGTWAQLYGLEIQHQYVTGVQFVGTTLFITAGDGSSPSTPGVPDLGQTFVTVAQAMQSLAGDRFVRTAWTELLDAE